MLPVFWTGSSWKFQFRFGPGLEFVMKVSKFSEAQIAFVLRQAEEGAAIGEVCLNAQWFMSLDDARAKCEAWRRDYNEVRPHSAIGNKPPITLVNRSGTHGPT